jgi:putative N6-adenine-specific DNA methylase
VDRYALAASATFGLESVVAAELAALGIPGARAENGRVLFDGTAEDLARCSLWLRAADRVLIRLAEFPAADFDQLYEGVRSVAWRDFLPENPRVLVTARSHLSALTAVPSIQSVAKKAVMDSLLGGPGRVEETGPLYPVEIALGRDRAVVSLDTSGDGLHKRGYRTEAGEAPLRETLAAALVLLSRWEPGRPFVDPLCGSGTIPIEAALIGLNLPPGAGRRFAAEQWPHLPAAAWREARSQAAESARRVPLRVLGADRDARVLEAAGRNAARAGVGAQVRFQHAELAALPLEGAHGCIVTNPPYGERIGGEREVEGLYRLMGRSLAALPTWSLFALSAHPGFERLIGRPASRRRKLYNGNLQCYYYQYFGPLPPRAAEQAAPRESP